MAKKKRRADFQPPPGVKKKVKRERPKKAISQPVAGAAPSALRTEPATPPSPSLHDQRMTKHRLGWRGEGLWHFPEHDVPRLVAEIKDFPELVRFAALAARQTVRRVRIENARKELLEA